MTCSLVFVPRNELICSELERKRYEAHQNSENNSDYWQYVCGISESILNVLPENLKGLDFGCGETKLLEKFLNNKGHKVFSYDVYFHPETKILQDSFDFIIMSEVIEHLRNPYDTLLSFKRILNKNGFLIVKTKLQPTFEKDFQTWFYKRDPTHIQFFNEHTLNWVRDFLNLREVKNIGRDIYLLGSMEEK